jgi:SAM-dependent methyltransferase
MEALKMNCPPIQDLLSLTTHSSASRESEPFEIQVRTVEALGFRYMPGCKVLDYGCGDGWLVSSYRQCGVQAYGCDVDLPDTPVCHELQQQGLLGRMVGDPLRVPFPSDMFDLVTSNMVFEHVRDYDAAFAELHRVLKPHGMMVHVFAARYSPLEQHCFVPLASIIQSYGWLYLWAALGIRNQFQTGCSPAVTARRNHKFLHEKTHYPTKRWIRSTAGKYFDHVDFREDAYLRFTPKGRRMPKFLPSRLVAALYGAARSRVLVATKSPIEALS